MDAIAEGLSEENDDSYQDMPNESQLHVGPKPHGSLIKKDSKASRESSSPAQFPKEKNQEITTGAVAASKSPVPEVKKPTQEEEKKAQKEEQNEPE